MRIALFHNLPSGGAKRAVREWTRGLGQAHTVDVYTLGTADHEFCDLRPLVHAHHVFAFRPHRRFRSPLGRLNRWQAWRDLGALIRTGREIAARIDGGAYDVVFAHPCLHTAVPPLLRFVATPAVHYLHEPVGRGFPPPIARPYARRARPLLDRLDPLLRLQQHAAERDRRRSLTGVRLLANSNFTRAWMVAAYAVEASVCRCGVDVEAFAPPGDDAGASGVLSVGELTPRKGFDFLIESVARIPAVRRPPLTLICNTGIPEETAYVQQLAARRGVALRLRWRLSTEELAEEYRRAALCLYAPIAEPFGLVPLEAMACGTPVVAVAEGGVPESMVDGVTGRLVARDPQAFCDAVRALLDDRSERRRLGANGRAHVQRDFTWAAAVAQVERQLDIAARRQTPGSGG
jgi:glycosyltransferase involved in cell wall biosynthesis